MKEGSRGKGCSGARLGSVEWHYPLRPRRGRNLFDALDRDGDGRLDLRELNGAAALLGGWAFLTREQIPLQVRIRARIGATGSAFGPVALAEEKKGPSGGPARAARGGAARL